VTATQTAARHVVLYRTSGERTRTSRPGPTYLKYRLAPSPTVRPRTSPCRSSPPPVAVTPRRYAPRPSPSPHHAQSPPERPDAMDSSPAAASSRGATGGARRC
jgi:hypothetical protein